MALALVSVLKAEALALVLVLQVEVLALALRVEALLTTLGRDPGGPFHRGLRPLVPLLAREVFVLDLEDVGRDVMDIEYLEKEDEVLAGVSEVHASSMRFLCREPRGHCLEVEVLDIEDVDLEV